MLTLTFGETGADGIGLGAPPRECLFVEEGYAVVGLEVHAAVHRHSGADLITAVPALGQCAHVAHIRGIGKFIVEYAHVVAARARGHRLEHHVHGLAVAGAHCRHDEHLAIGGVGAGRERHTAHRGLGLLVPSAAACLDIVVGEEVEPPASRRAAGDDDAPVGQFLTLGLVAVGHGQRRGSAEGSPCASEVIRVDDAVALGAGGEGCVDAVVATHLDHPALEYLASTHEGCIYGEGTEKLKPTIKLKVDDGEIAVLPFIICLF